MHVCEIRMAIKNNFNQELDEVWIEFEIDLKKQDRAYLGSSSYTLVEYPDVFQNIQDIRK